MFFWSSVSLKYFTYLVFFYCGTLLFSGWLVIMLWEPLLQLRVVGACSSRLSKALTQSAISPQSEDLLEVQNEEIIWREVYWAVCQILKYWMYFGTYSN